MSYSRGMRHLTCALLLLLATPLDAADWFRADVNRQTAYTVLHVADWLQTRDISHDCRRGLDAWEHNPMLGECPSYGEVNGYFAITLVAHYLTTDALPPRWRKPFQHFTIGMQASAVGHNLSLGFNFRF